MEQRSRGDFRLSGMTPDALIKSSSEAASLLPAASQLLPPMLPSLDAYLDAYRSLMSQDVQAMTALGGCGAGAGLGIRPPPGLTMPVLPTAAAAAAAAASLVSSPYYGLSPYSVDLARYGLFSPVYVPPFIGPLLCGGAGAGLLQAAEQPQSSPGVARSSADVPAAAAPQSFAKTLLEACAAARKSDSASTAAGGRQRQPETTAEKPAATHREPTDRAKPTVLASQRSVVATELQPTSDRKWNSSSKDVAAQSSTAVDFSARRTSDAGVKASFAGSTLSPSSWKVAAVSGAASLTAGKNDASGTAHTFGEHVL